MDQDYGQKTGFKCYSSCRIIIKTAPEWVIMHLGARKCYKIYQNISQLVVKKHMQQYITESERSNKVLSMNPDKFGQGGPRT